MGTTSLVKAGQKTRATTAHNSRNAGNKSFLKRRRESILKERLDTSISRNNNAVNHNFISFKSKVDLSD